MPDTGGTPDTPKTSKRPRRASARPSIRPEFMDLFRDTRLSQPGDQEPADREAADREPGDREAGAEGPPGQTTAGAPQAAPGPSRFLRRFLEGSPPAPEPAPSGLTILDQRLGGGFGPGLHLVLGAARSGKTAFLESLAWEAVGSRRPVLYYALKTGSLRVWERLIATLGTILDGSAIAPAALRGRELIPADVEALARLDAALQTSVLPYLALVDPTPATGNARLFVENLLSHAQEAVGQHGRLPLVLVDDLEALLLLTGSRAVVHALSALDTALEADSLPGLLAAPAGMADRAGSHLPARTIMSLKPLAAAPGSAGGRVDLAVEKNAATGWTGTVPLLLDHFSGLFTEAAAN
jgi:hypothetical protein